MELTDAMNIHKDKRPEDTILIARQELSKLSIFPIEASWRNISKRNISVRIFDPRYAKRIGTNGKGGTFLYALASAYGEYFERLQNQILYKRQYGLGCDFGARFPDEIKMKLSDYYSSNDQQRKIVDDLVPWNISEISNKEFTFQPYYNVKNKREEYLPLEIIDDTCGSNGMCAGNSTMEAIVQGLAEILERYALRMIFSGNCHNFPEYSIEMISKLEIFMNIIELVDLGFKIRILDLSLGNVIPVIGLLVYSSDYSKYRMALASDCYFEVALQRCCTEIMQGFSGEEFLDSMVDMNLQTNKYGDEEDCVEGIRREFFECFYRNNGLLPNSILLPTSSNRITNIPSVFLDKPYSHKEMYYYLIRIIDNMGGVIYIRNVTFTSINAFRIYIPGISDIFNFGKRNPNLVDNNKYYNVLLNLYDCPKEKIADLLEYFIIGNKDAKLSDIFKNVFNCCDIILEDDNGLTELTYLEILFVLNVILGRVEVACSIASQLLDEYDGLRHEKIYKSFSMYSCYFEKIKDKQEVFEAMIVAGLENVSQIKSMIEYPYSILDHYKFPRCNNCQECNVSRICKRSNWLKLQSLMQEMINDFDEKRRSMTGIFHEVGQC